MLSRCQGWAPPTNFVTPVITSLSSYYSPAAATALVSIHGANFYSYSNVVFGTAYPTPYFINTNQIDFYVPNTFAPGTYTVQVNNGSYPSNVVNYTIDNASGFWQLNSNGSISNTNTNPSSTTTPPAAGLAQLGALSLGAPLVINASNPVPTAAQIAAVNWILCDLSSSFLLTLPAAGQYAGRQLMVKSTQSAVTTSTPIYPLDSATTTTSTLLTGAGKWATLVSDGTYWIVMQAN